MIDRRSIQLLLSLLAALLPTALAAQPFEQKIAPFPVLRSNGAPYLNPFSGGLFQTRLGLADIDADGLPDLFALNPDNHLRFYRNEGGLRFRRVFPSIYDTVQTRNWFRIVDLNGDGGLDILTAGPTSEVLVIYNTGTLLAPRYDTPPTILRDAGGTTITTQRETVPALVDIDADGDLDLFSGNLDGTITFFRNTGSATAPAFALVTGSFEGIQIVSTKAKDEETPSLDGSSAHGASVLAFADLDGDLDLDIFFGDYLTRRLIWLHNLGSPTTPDFSMNALDTAFGPSGDVVSSDFFNQPSPADLDGDGDIDMLVSTLAPFITPQPVTLFENRGSSTSPLMRRTAIQITDEIDVGTYAAPAAIEDRERRGVLIGATHGTLSYFALIVENNRSTLRLAGTYPLTDLYQTAPAVGDLDGDGNAEVVIGDAEGGLSLFRFGSSGLESTPWQLDTFQRNQNTSPTLVDLDRDGDLDLFAGLGGGRMIYFENIGSATAALFTERTPPEPFNTLDVGNDATPRFFDFDRDGQLDVAIGSRTNTDGFAERDSIRFYLRRGDRFERSPDFRSLSLSNNPVPLPMQLPEGAFLFIGDLSGGMIALHDTTSVTSNVDDASDPARSATITQGSDGTLQIHWRAWRAAPTVTITDVMGRQILRTQLAGTAGTSTVDPTGLPAGLYLYRFNDGRSHSTGRLVITH